MPQIGPMEILVVGVLALLVFGPEKLPEMARTAGRALHQLKNMAADAKSQFDVATTDDESKSDSNSKATAATTSKVTGEDASVTLDRSVSSSTVAVASVADSEVAATAERRSIPAVRP